MWLTNRTPLGMNGVSATSLNVLGSRTARSRSPGRPPVPRVRELGQAQALDAVPALLPPPDAVWAPQPRVEERVQARPVVEQVRGPPPREAGAAWVRRHLRSCPTCCRWWR